MSSITISGDTSGSIILQAPAVSGSTTLTLPATSGTVLTSASSLTASQMPAGSVLQVVNSTFGTYVNTTSSTFADLGLSATITPSRTSSKILVTVFITGAGKNVGNTSGKYKLLRASTDILVFEGIMGYNNAASSNYGGATGTSYLDSPSTTSSTTYKVQFASSANLNGVYVNDYTASPTGNCTMTLMEIAG